MLGRRQIREKVIQEVYAYLLNPTDPHTAKKQLLSSMDGIYRLYLSELAFLVGLKELAEDHLDIEKSKFNPSSEELKRLERFANNPIWCKLEQNPRRLSEMSKNADLKWHKYDELLMRTFQRIRQSKKYQTYTEIENPDFDTHQRFAGLMFRKYITENEDFESRIASRDLNWESDLHIANSMTQATLGYIKEDQPMESLVDIFKNIEDKEFAQRLLHITLENWSTTEADLSGRLGESWEIERVLLIDRILLITAMSEMDHFPTTASRIIINEYIEIAKVFAAEKSQIFINGVLDRYAKEKNRV